MSLAVTKTLRFDAAHLLSGHLGKCRNLHGHTYRVDVTVASVDDGSDVVMDFRALKDVANAVICDRFDHAFIYNANEPVEREIAAVVEKNGLRTVPLSFRSTCENLARHFYRELKARIRGLASVKVWETSDNCSEYAE